MILAMSETIWIGAHTSAQGGVHNALLEGQEIGATTIQLFTSNQRQWKSRGIPEDEVALWKKTRDETAIGKIMSHDSYLINLGAANPEVYEKSLVAFEAEIRRCHLLELSFLNFHPGASVGGTKEECLDKIVKSLLSFEKLAGEGKTELLIECTAGQGTTMGSTFEEIGYMVRGTEKKLPIGVCIDTCHAFAAGYDLRTEEGLSSVLKEFDEKVGLKFLKALHLNDSIKGLGSHVDRHAPLGEGEIGIDAFKALMTHPKTKDLPKYLETPGGPPLWKKEIATLKRFAHAHTH